MRISDWSSDGCSSDLSAAALLILVLGVVIGMLGARVLDHEQRVAKLPSGGRVDVGFAQAMSAHHDQAMTMCRIVSPTASGAVGQIAHAIETIQLDRKSTRLNSSH